jgi:hypothetical protein
MSRYPSRIVCLTEETTETLYLPRAGRSDSSASPATRCGRRRRASNRRCRHSSTRSSTRSGAQA